MGQLCSTEVLRTADHCGTSARSSTDRASSRCANQGKSNKRTTAVEILRAARRLFAEHGYAGTSLQQIAEESGVAVQVIYCRRGRGNRPAPADRQGNPSHPPGERSLRESPPGTALGCARRTRRCCRSRRRFAPARVRRQRARPAPGGTGRLAAGTTPERAAAGFSMMTSPASWLQLTQRAGWTFDESEAWLTASLAQLVLEPSP